MHSLWDEIYGMCLNIMQSSMDLIYKDTNEIMAGLSSDLKEANKDSKKADSSSLSLSYLSTPENYRKFIATSPSDRKSIFDALEHTSNIVGEKIIEKIKN